MTLFCVNQSEALCCSCDRYFTRSIKQLLEATPASESAKSSSKWRQIPKTTTLYYRCKDTRLVVDPVEQRVEVDDTALSRFQVSNQPQNNNIISVVELCII